MPSLIPDKNNPRFGGGDVCSEKMQMICKLLQEMLVFFRLFFFFWAAHSKGPSVFPPNIVCYLKRKMEYISVISLNLMVVKKLWKRGHAFCYIIGNDDSYIKGCFLCMAGGK